MTWVFLTFFRYSFFPFLPRVAILAQPRDRHTPILSPGCICCLSCVRLIRATRVSLVNHSLLWSARESHLRVLLPSSLSTGIQRRTYLQHVAQNFIVQQSTQVRAIDGASKMLRLSPLKDQAPPRDMMCLFLLVVRRESSANAAAGRWNYLPTQLWIAITCSLSYMVKHFAPASRQCPVGAFRTHIQPAPPVCVRSYSIVQVSEHVDTGYKWCLLLIAETSTLSFLPRPLFMLLLFICTAAGILVCAVRRYVIFRELGAGLQLARAGEHRPPVGGVLGLWVPEILVRFVQRNQRASPNHPRRREFSSLVIVLEAHSIFLCGAWRGYVSVSQSSVPAKYRPSYI